MTMQDDKTDGNGAAPVTVPARPLINPFALFAQRNRGGGFFRGPLIKCEHTTGEFLRVQGETKTLVEAGERFVANVYELTDMWSKWVGGKLVDRRVYRAINGEMAPPREELGDVDEGYWPLKGNKPKDPWQRQVYLPMRGRDGEVCAFVASGQGAISEVGELVGMYASTDRQGKFPVVELGTRNFESQHGSIIYVPRFSLVDWQYWQPDTPAPPVALVPMPQPVTPAITSAKTEAIANNSDTPTKSQKKRGSVGGGGLDDEIPFAPCVL